MKKNIKQVILAILTLSASQESFAVGETFRLKVTGGTEYCNPFDYGNSQSGYRDIWIRVDSDTQITIARTVDFSQYPITLQGRSFLYGRKLDKFAFSGSQFLQDDGSYITIAGTGTLDKSGLVKSMAGTAIYNWTSTLHQPDPYAICFARGTFTTGKRIFP